MELSSAQKGAKESQKSSDGQLAWMSYRTIIHVTNCGSGNEAVPFSTLLLVYDWWKKIDKQLNPEASFTYL